MDIRYEQRHNSENPLPFTLYPNNVRTMDRRSEKSNFHEEYELEYCHEGEGFVLVDGKSIPFRAGELILIHPGEVHYTGSESALTYSALLFPKDTFRRLDIQKEGTPHFPHHIRSEEVTRAFYEIRRICDEKPTFFKARALCALIDLCLALAPHIEARGDTGVGRNKTVILTLEYIRNHYAEPLTLDGIAHALYQSKYTLCHLFRQYTGESIVTHIHRVRIGVAAELLAKGESVSDTAHAVGFENLSFFTKIFKRYQGITPSDFQKKKTEEV